MDSPGNKRHRVAYRGVKSEVLGAGGGLRRARAGPEGRLLVRKGLSTGTGEAGCGPGDWALA